MMFFEKESAVYDRVMIRVGIFCFHNMTEIPKF